MTVLEKQGAAAKKASLSLATASTKLKNAALKAIADTLIQNKDEWLKMNAVDISNAKENGMRSSMVDRLTLNEKRINDIAESIYQLIALPDPIGKMDNAVKRPNGLIIGKKRVPLGVIAIIYEARPNVTVDAASLCLKSGNVCILRGGKEAINSNLCAVKLMRKAISSVGLPEDCISIVENTDRESANELMHQLRRLSM